MGEVTFDPEEARLHEAERRLRLLGNLADSEYDYDRLRNRARAVYVPARTLREWLHDYELGGIDGLKPDDWTELDSRTQEIVLERHRQLGPAADAETITPDDISELQERNGWSYWQATRWLRRYRMGGPWSLDPVRNPWKPRRPKRKKPDMATLDKAQLEEIFRKRDILGDLADKPIVTNEEVRERAAQTGVCERTIRSHISDFRDYNLDGLTRRVRSDKGKRHGISDRMIQVVEGIRLSQYKPPIHKIHEQAAERAHALGEAAPSLYQVKAICDSIPSYIKNIADRREHEFRNKERITYPIRFKGVVYQIDHTPVDVLVKDMRKPRYQTKSGETRLHLSKCIDSRSRKVVAARFGYDRADRFVVAALIRDSLLPPHGKPDEIWVDHGKELICWHVKRITRELKIKLFDCPPHQPQLRGIGERFFETLNTRLWSTLDGYVGPNVVERNPNVKAKLTPAGLVAKFWEFIEKYHTEKHSKTGMTPTGFWDEHCFAEAVDPRSLDILLMEQFTRKVTKKGISYGSRIYWHGALGSLAGKSVLIRVEPSYAVPDSVLVFYEGEWVCEAFATDSPTGKSVTRSQIRAAQREQRRTARRRIDDARSALKEADREIGDLGKGDNNAPDSAPRPESTKPASKPEAHKPPKREANVLDRMSDPGPGVSPGSKDDGHE